MSASPTLSDEKTTSQVSIWQTKKVNYVVDGQKIVFENLFDLYK